MVDVAEHIGARPQRYPRAIDRPLHDTVDRHFLRNDVADDGATLAQHQFRAVDGRLDMALDLQRGEAVKRGRGLEIGAPLDDQRAGGHGADDMGARLQMDMGGMDLALDPAGDDGVPDDMDVAEDRAILTEDQAGAGHTAMHRPVDMQRSGADQAALDDRSVADAGRLARRQPFAQRGPQDSDGRPLVMLARQNHDSNTRHLRHRCGLPVTLSRAAQRHAVCEATIRIRLMRPQELSLSRRRQRSVAFKPQGLRCRNRPGVPGGITPHIPLHALLA